MLSTGGRTRRVQLVQGEGWGGGEGPGAASCARARVRSEAGASKRSNSTRSIAASASAEPPRCPEMRTSNGRAYLWERDETCPVSTAGWTRRIQSVREGWTRRVHFVREGGGGVPGERHGRLRPRRLRRGMLIARDVSG